MVKQLDTASRDSLLRLHDLAKRASAAEREQRWYDVARFAVEHAQSMSDPPAADSPEVISALRDASSRLPAGTLVAVAARGAHPLLSEAFCRVVEREGPGKLVDGPAEAVAEARDGLTAYGGVRGKALLDVVKRGRSPAPGAGAIQRSVYLIEVLGERAQDSTSKTFEVAEGIRAGVTLSCGSWAKRFQIVARSIDSAAPSAGTGVRRSLTSNGRGPGVVVVADGAETWASSVAVAGTLKFLAIDARGPEDVNPRELSGALLVPQVMVVDSSRSTEIHGFGPRDKDTPIQLRASSAERARRIGQVLLRRTDLRRIAIAVPEHGGDRAFASGVWTAVRALDREARVYAYAPGRRSFAAEADTIAEMQVDAIVFAGAGEETAEWVQALSARRLAPLILGDVELDPLGFHEPIRRLLEGAVFVGSDWVDRDPGLVRALESIEPERLSEPFRRGFRFGWNAGRLVVDGAFTPTALNETLDERTYEDPGFGSVRSYLGRGARKKFVPTDVELPVFTIRGGLAIPYEIK